MATDNMKRLFQVIHCTYVCDKGGQTRGQHTKHLVTPTSFQELLKAGLGLGTGA